MVREDVAGRVEVSCTYYGECFSVHQPLVACSKYEERNALELHELRRIAWVLQTDKNKRITGFRPPKQDDDD
jgi:hypothetical protein